MSKPTIRVLGIGTSVRRNSNSGRMLEYLLGEVGDFDTSISTSLRHLAELSIACIGCEGCYNDLYFHRDSLTDIYEEMLECHILVIATPTCFGMPSALGKVFMDRSDPLWFEQKLKGKLGAAIVSGASNNGRSERCRDNVHSFFEAHGMLAIPGGVCATLASEYDDQRYPTALPETITNQLSAMRSDMIAIGRQIRGSGSGFGEA
jgi:multimeric flavodoxin WrbA